MQREELFLEVTHCRDGQHDMYLMKNMFKHGRADPNLSTQKLHDNLKDGAVVDRSSRFVLHDGTKLKTQSMVTNAITNKAKKNYKNNTILIITIHYMYQDSNEWQSFLNDIQIPEDTTKFLEIYIANFEGLICNKIFTR